MKAFAAILDRKLLRDLWRIKGQGLAIVAVIAAGVGLYVMSAGMLASLRETMDAYYDRYNFADAFAPVKRAPRAALADIAALPGVAQVQGRVRGGALVDIEGVATPVTGEIVSLAPFERTRLNDVYLVSGRMIDFGRPRDILLLEPFARAHGLEPGDALTATVYGVRRTFLIAGLALSPEHVYTIAPGEFVPDDRRFAVLWLGEDAAEAAFDLEGAFNEALVRLERGGRGSAVIDGLDRLLARYGSTGAYLRENQLSHRFLSEELKQLEMMGRILPPIFLGVAAFLLNIVVSRMIDAERTQIGLMKAFGYSDGDVGSHYAKFAFVLAGLGAVAGCGLGLWLGAAMGTVYQEFYKFPFLLFAATPGTYVVGAAVSFAAAGFAALFSVRRAVSLTPADAMRPPAPPDYASIEAMTRTIERPLDQMSRIVLRRLVRRPTRAGLTVVGVGAAMALCVMMAFNYASINYMIDVNFNVVDRSDVVVRFVEPQGRKAVYELMRVEGVLAAEAGRDVPVILRNGVRKHLGAVTGLEESARLNRAVDKDLAAIAPRGDGLALSKALADILGARAGDMVTVEAREGRRPTIEIPVTAVAATLVGAPAYMEIEALSRLLGEGWRATSASLLIDPARREAVLAEIKEMPRVAGVSSANEAEAAFTELMEEGSGVFRRIFQIFATVITVGVVYNAARIAFAEAAHDLASLRVLGFTKGEAAYVLLGEIFSLTLRRCRSARCSAGFSGCTWRKR